MGTQTIGIKRIGLRNPMVVKTTGGGVVVPTNNIITENGFSFMTEDNNHIIHE
jgi:hypothetical protein